MPAEEYRAMKKEKELPKEANDVKLAKLQDAFIRKQDAKKIKENRDWDQLASQLKPIFSAQQGDIQEMLKPISINTLLLIIFLNPIANLTDIETIYLRNVV